MIIVYLLWKLKISIKAVASAVTYRAYKLSFSVLYFVLILDPTYK